MKLTAKQYLSAVDACRLFNAHLGVTEKVFNELNQGYDVWAELNIEGPTRALQHPSRKMRGGDRNLLFNGPRDGGVSAQDSYNKAMALLDGAHPVLESFSPETINYLQNFFEQGCKIAGKPRA